MVFFIIGLCNGGGKGGGLQWWWWWWWREVGPTCKRGVHWHAMMVVAVVAVVVVVAGPVERSGTGV